MDKTKDLSSVSIEVDGELIFVTVAKYKLFLSYGKIGLDAYLLYSHLMFTARLQHTNSVHAKEVYLRQGLEWGKDRLYKAKKLLTELGIIETIKRKGEDGRFVGSYISVKTKTTPFEIESIGTNSGGRENHSPVTDHKCFNEEVKCFNEEVKDADLSAFSEIRELFESISHINSGESYYHDGKQARAIKLLESRYLNDKRKFYDNVNKFAKMIKESGNSYYMSLPLDPHTFNSNYNAIVSYSFKKDKPKSFREQNPAINDINEMSDEEASFYLKINQKQLEG